MTHLAKVIPPPKTFGVLEFDHWRGERVRLAYDNYRRRLKNRVFQKGELELLDFPVEALPADCLGKELQIFIDYYIQIHSAGWTKEDDSKRVSESTFNRALIRKGVRPTIQAELYRWVRDYQKYADRVGLNKDEVGQRITQLKKAAKSVYLRARQEVLGEPLPELEAESEGKTDRDESVEHRREVMFGFLKRSSLKVKGKKDAARVLRNTKHLHQLYKLFAETETMMISSSQYRDVTWSGLEIYDDLQEMYDEQIANYLVKDMQRNWGRLWDKSH